MFAKQTGVKLVHVPYRGIAPAVTDTVAGRMDMLFASYVSTGGHIEAGKLRMLAIAGTQRHPRIADVPTMPEAGFPDVQMQQWFGLFAPAGTPAAIVRKLNEEFVKALQSDDVKNKLLPQVVIRDSRHARRSRAPSLPATSSGSARSSRNPGQRRRNDAEIFDMSLEYAPRGLVGMLTPQANTTVEPEFNLLWPPGVAMINARLMSDKGTIAARLVDYFANYGASLRQFANAPIERGGGRLHRRVLSGRARARGEPGEGSCRAAMAIRSSRRRSRWSMHWRC